MDIVVISEEQLYGDKQIESIHIDKNNFLWIGSLVGLFQFNEAKELVNYHIHDNQDNNSISDNNIQAIIEDEIQGLWVGSYFGGLNYFDTESGEFTNFRHIKENPTSIASDNIVTLLEDQSSYIWAGSWDGGLSRLDRKSNQFTNYYHVSGDIHSLSNSSVISLLQDTNGVIWVGTTNGLNRYNKDTDNFTRFGIKEGLPDAYIAGILEDDNGNLWLSTHNGLSKFNKDKLIFTNYSAEDGLLNVEFNRAALKTKDGELFFGGKNGLLSFYPEDIKTNNHIPEVILTEFLLFNKPVKVVSATEIKPTEEEFYLNKSINATEELILNHQQNLFSFEFSALDFVNPKKNQYAYRLEGWDKDWIYTDYKNRRATYTNIPEGDYTLRVKASNNDGLWNEQGTSIKLKILPPPWRTWWAYTIYSFLSIGLIILISFLIYRRKLAEKDKASALAIASAKDQLFSNVSHEFRTPLTLILGPLERFIIEAKTDQDKHELSLIKRNGQRLLSMVDQLLDLARFRGESVTERKPQNVNQLCRVICHSFQTMAESTQIDLTLEDLTEVTCWVMMVPDSMEKILTNLLSNGFKYTPSGGHIQVTIEHQDNQLKLSVKDTGYGISKHQLQQIFERFTRLENTQSDSAGTGIGLALVKELVESHQGFIEVSSVPDEGSCFTILLPTVEASEIESLTQSNDLYPEGNSECYVDNMVESLTPIKAYDVDENSDESHSSDINQPKLLIIEDNLELSQYMVAILSANYDCTTAFNGQSGVETAIDLIPDLIISDVMMPVMDGFEACRLIKQDQRTSHIPVLLLTARGDKASRLQGWQGNADEYLTKPFDRDELLIRIESLLSIRQLLKQHYVSYAANLHQDKSLNTEKKLAPEQQKELDFINKLEKIMSQNYTDPEFKVALIASEIAMSQRQLYRKLKALTDMTPTDYLRAFRLARAAELIEQGEAAGNVSLSVGFSSHSYFSNCFKARFGCTPSKYSKN